MQKILFYVSLKRNFFSTHHSINCPVPEFCACDGANLLDEVSTARGQRLKKIEGGILISDPIPLINQPPKPGNNVSLSLSHLGILGICSYLDGHVLVLKDLFSDKQRTKETMGPSIAAFYDDNLILLTSGNRIKECCVGSVIDGSFNPVSGIICTQHTLNGSCDVSTLQSTRELYYLSIDGKVYKFNVDSRQDVEYGILQDVMKLGSVGGIDVGAKFVFQEYFNKCATYSVKGQFSEEVIGVNIYTYSVDILLPSQSNPQNMSKAIIKYGNAFYKDGEALAYCSSFPFAWHNSFPVVRVFEDVFLTYSDSVDSWVLFRISIL